MNYMNIIGNRTQMLHNRLWAVFGNSPESRIIHFILSHTERLSAKNIENKMEDLAQIINETRTGGYQYYVKQKDWFELHHGEINTLMLKIW